MERLFLAILLLTSAMAAEGAQSGISSNARFFYFENIPNHKQRIVFTLKKACDVGFNLSPFAVQDFYSEHRYYSTNVRIVHLYGHYNRSCKHFSGNNFEQTFVIPPAKESTHVYVTTDANVEVRSEQ